MSFSTYHGGIVPWRSRILVRRMIAIAWGRNILICDERHRRHTAGSMTLLTAPLENRRDVPGEGYLAGRILLGGGGDGHGKGDSRKRGHEHGHRGPDNGFPLGH